MQERSRDSWSGRGGFTSLRAWRQADARGQIISALHTRFPEFFTPPFVQLLLANLKPSRSNASDRDIREKEDNARIIRQRGLLRTLGELEAVGIVRKDGGKGAVGDMSWGVLRELVRRCPS